MHVRCACAQQHKQPHVPCRWFVFQVTGSCAFNVLWLFHFNSLCTFYTLRWILCNYFHHFYFHFCDAYKRLLAKWSARLAPLRQAILLQFLTFSFRMHGKTYIIWIATLHSDWIFISMFWTFKMRWQTVLSVIKFVT